MIPGIDPKVDIVFKKVYGTERTRDLLVHLIHAVLQPTRWRRLVDVQLMNPYTEKMSLDDKLAILDIKARDQDGWLYHLEMQMLAMLVLPQRFLFYWSKTYVEQLTQGNDYGQLRPTISICFVNGDVFPDRTEYHHVFRLLTPDSKLCLTNDLEIHIIEISKFNKTLEELRTPLDLWLYFFKNGDKLDADDLPEPLNTPEIRKAMEILKMFAQNSIERELYEGRLKAQRDMAAWESERRLVRHEVHEMSQQLDQTRRELDQTTQQLDQTTQQLDQTTQQLGDSLLRRIQLCQRLLHRPVSDAGELAGHSSEQLRELADRLEQEVTDGRA